jgi:hypothetical protein
VRFAVDSFTLHCDLREKFFETSRDKSHKTRPSRMLVAVLLQRKHSSNRWHTSANKIVDRIPTSYYIHSTHAVSLTVPGIIS